MPLAGSQTHLWWIAEAPWAERVRRTTLGRCHIDDAETAQGADVIMSAEVTGQGEFQCAARRRRTGQQPQPIACARPTSARIDVHGGATLATDAEVALRWWACCTLRPKILLHGLI